MSDREDYQERLSQLETKRRRERGDEPLTDRELFLKSLAQVEKRLLDKVEEARSVRTPAQGEKGEPGKPSSALGQIAAIIAAVTALVTSMAAILKPAPDTKTAEAYEALRAELVKQNEAIQKNGENDELRWNFTAGLFKAMPGVKLTDQPGTPKVEPLELAPAPLVRKPVTAPTIQVREPLPAPVSSVAPVQLPKNLAALPSLKK